MDLLQKSLLAIERRYLSGEERLLSSLQKLEASCTEARDMCTKASRSAWWTLLGAILAAVIVTFFLTRFFLVRSGAAPLSASPVTSAMAASPVYHAAAPPLFMPLPTAQSQVPPTPLFVMPHSFLPEPPKPGA